MRNKRPPVKATTPHKRGKGLKEMTAKNRKWKITLITAAHATNGQNVALTFLLLLLRALRQPRPQPRALSLPLPLPFSPPSLFPLPLSPLFLSPAPSPMSRSLRSPAASSLSLPLWPAPAPGLGGARPLSSFLPLFPTLSLALSPAA